MADDSSSSRWKPKPPANKFNWIGDPADRFRGRGGKARITGGDAGTMLDYDKSLYEPMDRGGGQAFRVNGQPERFAGTPAAPPPAEAPLPTTNAGILARYRTPQPGRATVRPTGVPSVGTPPPVVDIAPPATLPQALITPGATGPADVPGADGNPYLAPAPVATNPALGVRNSPATPFSSAEGEIGVHPPETAGGLPPTNIQEDIGTPGAGTGGDITSRAGVHPVTGQPITPESQVEEEKREWAARGGTQRTWDRNQAAAGVKPRIDARAPSSPLNSNASAAIQAKWAADRAARLAALKQAATN